MLTYTPYIYTMFSNIVADVQAKAGVSIHYEHGHLLEVVNTIRGMQKTPSYDAIRFPLIALLQDYDEKKGEGHQVMSKVSLNIVICTLTKPELVASQRLCSTFIPVLYPIYDFLMESILKSGYFSAYSLNDLKHTKTDRMYWGKKGLAGNEGNIFGDYVDAIEIQNLELIVKKPNCI